MRGPDGLTRHACEDGGRSGADRARRFQRSAFAPASGRGASTGAGVRARGRRTAIADAAANECGTMLCRRFAPPLSSSWTEAPPQVEKRARQVRIVEGYQRLDEIDRSTQISACQRLAPPCGPVGRIPAGIQDVVFGAVPVRRCSGEQTLNPVESAIRRRFVPGLFRRSMPGWIFAGSRPIWRVIADSSAPGRAKPQIVA